MLPLAIRLRRWLTAAALVALVGCQASSATPTVAPTLASPPTASVPPTPASAATAAAPSAAASPSATRPAAPPTAPAVGTSRVETLNAANAAFDSNDLKTAAGLYDRVVNTPPPSSEAPAATAAIDDLADFRSAVLLLADGSDDEARSRLDELQKRNPNAPLARLGNQLYEQYSMTGALRGACAQLQPQIATQAAPTLATLHGLGVSVDPTTLCSVRQA